MYANMSHLDAFKQYVVRDGRSYSVETFEKAVKIINSTKKSVNVDHDNKLKFEGLAKELSSLKNSLA